MLFILYKINVNFVNFLYKTFCIKRWCQELVGIFLTLKKLFDFNSLKERQILMKFNKK